MTDIQRQRSAAPARGRQETPVRWSYRPRIDVTEDADGFTVFADLPGVAAENVEIGFANSALKIRATVPQRQPAEQQYFRHEYGIGDFDREIVFPDGLDAAKITAEVADGVLRVNVPKSEAARPRRIPVRSA